MGIKPTNKQIKERVIEVARMLCEGHTKGEIKRQFIDKYQVSYRTVENYIARARELLLEEINRPIKQLVSESYGFYLSVIRSNADVAEKIKARRHIDKLLGLEAPSKHELSGPDGAPIPTTSDLTKEELYALIEERKRITGQNADTPGTTGA